MLEFYGSEAAIKQEILKHYIAACCNIMRTEIGPLHAALLHVLHISCAAAYAARMGPYKAIASAIALCCT